MGGGCGGSGAFQCFSQRNLQCCSRQRDQGARQATINRPAAAGRKGVGYVPTRFAGKKPSPYKIEGMGGRFGRRKRKNIIARVWFEQCGAARSEQ